MGIAEHGATGALAIANPGQETKMDFCEAQARVRQGSVKDGQ